MQKFKALLEEVKRWEKVKVLRDYLNYVEQRGQKGRLSEEEFFKWLNWAKKKADWYDPMIESLDDLLINIDKESLSFKKKEI